MIRMDGNFSFKKIKGKTKKKGDGAINFVTKTLVHIVLILLLADLVWNRV